MPAWWRNRGSTSARQARRRHEGLRRRSLLAQQRTAPGREPDVGAHDVLLAVHAASLNPLDGKIRDGEFKLFLPCRLPLILGNDVAGIVVSVGPKVRGFKPGDAVHARPGKDRIGTFAEPRHPKQGKAPRRELLLSLHAGEWPAVEPDHPLIEAGAIHPMVDRTVPFLATNQAMQYLATGRAKGKVVINLA